MSLESAVVPGQNAAVVTSVGVGSVRLSFGFGFWPDDVQRVWTINVGEGRSANRARKVPNKEVVQKAAAVDHSLFSSPRL